MKALLINPTLDLSYYDRLDPKKFNFEIDELNYTFSSDDSNIDNSINESVLNKLHNRDFDFYCIPINITSLLTSFDGIRLGIHIRLTKNLSESLRTKPILFFGEMTVAQINQINPVGQFLFSKGVMYVDYNLQSIIDFYTRHLNELMHGQITLDYIINELHDWIRVSPPPHLDSSHAITNEWGVYRLADSILMDEDLRPKLDELFQRNNISNSLYFKHLVLKNDHQLFKKDKKRIDPKIGGIENKSIVYIDDEFQKGWGLVLSEIFEKSGATLFTFNGFDKSQTKESLIHRIVNWLQNETINSSSDKLLMDADLFIIDLRLHDNDFGNTNFDQLTGFQLVKALKFGNQNASFKENPGRQVLMFTASNKVWNMKIANDVGASAFIVKESPSFFSTREDTKAFFREFSRGVKNAIDKNYLAKLFEINRRIKSSFHHPLNDFDEITDFKKKLCDSGGWLDQYFKLLLIDDEKTRNQVFLILFQILENYSTLSRLIDYDTKQYNYCRVMNSTGEHLEIFTQSSPGYLSSRIKFEESNFCFQKPNTGNVYTKINFFQRPQIVENFVKGEDVRFLIRCLPLLKFMHSTETSDLAKLIELRFIRSNLAAHDTGRIDVHKRNIEIDDINFLLKLFKELFTVE